MQDLSVTYEESVRIIRKELAVIVRYGRGGVITIQDSAALVRILRE